MRNNQSEKWVHPHPAAIILYSLRQALLLLIPIVRALFSFGEGFAAWNDYMWVDLLAVGMMFLFGFLRWLSIGYRLQGSGILHKSGLLIRKKGFIPFSEISVVVQKRLFWLRPIGYCSVYIDTEAGKSKNAEFTIDLRSQNANRLTEAIQSVCRDVSVVKRVCSASSLEVLFLSFLSSDSLSGILFLSAAISGLGDFVSVDVAGLIRQNFKHLYQWAGWVTGYIPPIAAWIAYILLISWTFSFLIHALRHLRFTVTRQDDTLQITNGILSRYLHTMKVSKIGRIEMRQTLITRLIGICTVFVQCCGYGKIEGSLAALLPGGSDLRAMQRLSFLLPEYTLSKRELKPKKRYLLRICNHPLLCMLGSVILLVTLPILFPILADTLLFMGFAILFPCIWYLLVKLCSYTHVGVGRVGDTYTFTYTYGFRFLTTMVQKDKITRIQINQTVFQKLGGGCDLLIYTRYEKRSRIRIPNLNQAEVEAFFGLQQQK